MRTITELKYTPEMVNVSDLSISKYNARYNRVNQGLVEQLRQSIIKRGYDENFPLTIGYLKDSETPEVLGGGHRFTACQKLNIQKLPANVYRDLTPEEAISISINTNENQKTFVPETFIDRAYQVNRLLEDRTQAEVGAILDISRPSVGFYNAIVVDLVPEVLQIVEDTFATRNLMVVAKEEKPLVAENATRVAWQFSWFRYITQLTPKYQRAIIQKIIDNAKKITRKKIKGHSDTYKARQTLEDYFREHLPDEFLDDYIGNLDSGSYDQYVTSTNSDFTINASLIDTVESLKQEAANRMEHKRFQQFIPTILDKSIDCLCTDPPYGKDYKSNRRQDKTDDVNVKLVGDSPEDAIVGLRDCLKLIDGKMKDDSHCYIFCAWKKYPEFKSEIEKYYKIKNLLIWHKNNHGAGDLSKSYAPKYECIIFGIKGDKSLKNGRVPDVLNFAKLPKDRQHPTEKPVDLLEMILSRSCSSGETVCDPFAGVGSTLVAAKKLGLRYAGCECESQYASVANMRLKEVE